MQALFRSLILAAALVAAPACSVTPAGTFAEAPGTVAVKGHLALRGPRYRLATATPTFGRYTKAEITEVKVFLTRGDGEEQALGSLGSAEDPIQLGNLKQLQTYKVRLEAWTTIDGDAERIDTEDDRCITEFTTDETTHVMADKAFFVTLENRTYPGRSIGSLRITTGGLTSKGIAAVIAGSSPEYVPGEDPPPPNPCDTNPFDPNCPGYDPCMFAWNEPGCPGYDPCEDDPTPDCYNYCDFYPEDWDVCGFVVAP